MQKDRPVPFKIKIEDTEVMETNRAYYYVLKKANYKLVDYAKKNNGMENVSRLFDFTPLIEQIRNYPMFQHTPNPKRNMNRRMLNLFKFLNDKLLQYNLYGVIRIEDSYDRYLGYRISMNTFERILIVNKTGETYDEFSLN